MNNVSLIGTLIVDPDLSTGRDGREQCVMQIGIPRRGLQGEYEPGLVYIDVTTFGGQAKVCANELRAGDRVGISGTLERDDSLEIGPRRSRWEVHANQIEVLPVRPATASDA